MSEPGLVDVTGRLRIAGGDAWSLGGVRAAEQRAALPGRSADGRGDHCS